MRTLIESLEFLNGEGDTPPIEPLVRERLSTEQSRALNEYRARTPKAEVVVRVIESASVNVQVCVPYEWRGKRVRLTLEIAE